MLSADKVQLESHVREAERNIETYTINNTNGRE